MLHANMLRSVLICLAVAGCSDAGERYANQWIQAQQTALALPKIEPVPPVIDTPPANYTSKTADPFSYSRISARTGGSGLGQRTDVLFPEAPLSGLVVAGYLSGENRVPVAMVRYGAQYRAVRIGDRLGERAALVKQIAPQGVLVVDGESEQWLSMNKS